MAGETALSRQLKKLAAPQSTLLIQDKLRKSFLFDHREAAALGRDEIFAYGTNGLEKLKLSNPMFAEFESNLFHVTYKDMERSVQSTAANKKLDKKINDFLRMLSPYVIFRAAHEALEWLIYRFHIHLYNTDELVACALPHYYSSTFVRVVQLLDLNDPNSRWAWLLPVQKSGIPLGKAAILNRINGDGGFKKYVCDMAPNSLKVFASCTSLANPVVSFSTLTIYEAVCKCESLTDNMITFLFPYILKGVQSGHYDYMCSSYLIVSAIVMKVKLADIVLFDLLTKVFQNFAPELAKEAFELLVLVFQQQSVNILPFQFFKLLVSIKDCINHLVYMSEHYDVSSLIRAIVGKSVSYTLRLQLRVPTSNKCKKATLFCKTLVNSLKLNERNAVTFVKSILLNYLKLQANAKLNVKSMRNTAKMLLTNLEKNYPEYFDKAVENYFKKKKGKLNRKVCILINESVNSLKNKVVSDIQTTLVLGVNHAKACIRKSSIKYMLEQVALGQVYDKTFIESTLYDRLSDDDPEVVMEVLVSPNVLLHFVDKQKLLGAFERLFKRKINRRTYWYQVQMKCLGILCESYIDETYLAFEIFCTLLPFIFPLQKSTIDGFHKIMNSKLKSCLPVLQTLHLPDFKKNEKSEPEEVLLKMNVFILSSLKKYIIKLDSSSKSLFLTFLWEKSKDKANNSIGVIFLLTAGHAMCSNVKLEQKLVWIEHLIMFFESLTTRNILNEDFSESMDEETLSEKYLEALQTGHFPSLVVYYTFYKVITEMKLDFGSTIDSWLPKENHDKYTSFKILTLLYKFCVNQIAQCIPKFSTETFKLLLTVFLQTRFETVQHLFYFLSHLWADLYVAIPNILQAAALKSALESTKDSKNLDWFFDKSQDFICLVQAMASPDAAVRKTGFELLTLLLQKAKKSSSAFKVLAEYLYENREEIFTDNSQCYNTVNKWLSPAAEIYSLSSSKSTKELNNQYSVLKEFIKILSDDNSPNSIKCTILLCLHGTDSVGLLSAYIPVLNKYLSFFAEKENLADEQCKRVLELLLQKFSPVTAVCLKDDCLETEVFFKCLQLIEQDDATSSVQSMMLKCLTREFFVAIPSTVVQKKLLDTLLDSYLNSTSDVGVKLKKVLGKLATYAYWIIKEFQDTEASQKQTTLKDLKKLKLKENSNSFESKAWKKITVLLELAQSKSKLDKRELLIPELFNILNKTLSFDSQSSVEYVKQLILSTIHNCCQNLGDNRLDERQFKVELIVQCIRSSTNPKTHHQSLLLLNLAATIFPEYVLSNVMSIFTFMGSSLVRQDDSYSFQVISQTIETIVPSLLAASSFQKENDAMQIVASVIRVFVDSLSDIPQHRQLPLFHKLIITLEPSQYLWIPLAQICDHYATVFHSMLSSDESEWKNAPTLEFAINLLKLFTPTVQIDTCINLLNFLSMLPDRKEKSTLTPPVKFNFTEPFNVSAHSDQQLQMYKCNVLSCINIWLSSQVFVSQVSELDPKGILGLEEKYEMLLEKTLSYLQHQRSVMHLFSDDSKSTYNLFPLLFDLIGHINTLLPCSLFIRVVRRLLQNPEVAIQQKVIELLNSKLEQQQYIFTEENHKPLLKLLSPLLKIVQKKERDSDNENSPLNQQTALYAVHLLTKVIGAEYPTKFYKVLNVTINILKDNENEALTVNALLCLAQLCSSLNIEVLPQLNTFMPIVVGFLSDYNSLALNDCLILGIVTALLSIVENLGMFLSCYLQSIVTGICMLSSKYQQCHKKMLHEKLLTFQTVFAKDIDLRILLIAIDDSYSNIKSLDHDAIIPLMSILEEKLSNCSYTDVATHSSEIEQFCLKLVDFRNSSNLFEPISLVESSIISVLKTFVMKLPVSNFYNFFHKLYQWATTHKLKLRLFTFYNLTCHLSKSLKSLFLIPAKTFLKHAASDLDSNNVSKNKTIDFADDSGMLCEHLNNILDTLNTCFLHDDNKLMDKDSFEFLMQPLVDQLENCFDSDEKTYQERISNYLCTCIARFMASVSDNTLWKKLNYQILLKTRHDSSVVRFASIQVIREVVTVMGDNYLVLLPESIPFLAEIMEDESSEVEQECNSVITEMEKILGEPIRKYF